jgi:trehalose 6-phosphate synthase
MHLFRLRLILALIASVTLVSVASTYFEVLEHKHVLRVELERRVRWMGVSIEPDLEHLLASSDLSGLAALVERSKANTGAVALAVFDAQHKLLASSGPQEILQALPGAVVEKSLRKGAEISAFGHLGDAQWLEEAMPLHDGDKLEGSLAIVADAGHIRIEGIAVWQRSFWRIAALVVLIVVVTVVMVSWFLLRPMTQVAESLKRLRLRAGSMERPAEGSKTSSSLAGLNLFSPLAREVETMAESLIEARASAAAEARLRDAGEHSWTAERLAVHMRDRSGSSRIFVVSNREPYMHVKQGRETVCIVPPSGLVTAIEPVLRACDGVWVAALHTATRMAFSGG